MTFNPVKMNPISLIDACTEELSTRAYTGDAKALSKVAIDCLRLDGNRLPPSLAKFLAYDYTFYAMCNDWGEFDNAFPIGQETTNEWEPVFLQDEIEKVIQSLAWRPIEELKLVAGDLRDPQVMTKPLDYLKLSLPGKLFRLPNVGNQTHFLYVGNADKHGEYPVLGMEMKGDMVDENTFWGQLDLFVKYPNFAVYMYDQIFDATVFPEDFVVEMDEIYHNNPDLCLNFKGSLELLS